MSFEVVDCLRERCTRAHLPENIKYKLKLVFADAFLTLENLGLAPWLEVPLLDDASLMGKQNGSNGDQCVYQEN